MKSLRVNFDETDQSTTPIENATIEPWDDVCERFDNDVHRIMTVSDQEDFTAIYACYDDNNEPAYYLVEEDEDLAKLRRKIFLKKLGRARP